MPDGQPSTSAMASLIAAATPIPTFTVPEFIHGGARVLKRLPSLSAVYLRRRLEPAFRERLWVAVSAANVCRYCSFLHQDWARRVGVSEADICRLESLEATDLERQLRVASDYVVAFVRSEVTPVPERIRVLFESEFSPETRHEIESLARLANLANLTGNTFDAFLARLHRQPFPDSHLGDELVISVIFLWTALLVLPVLCLARQQLPMGLFRDFQLFSRRFHERVPI